MTGGFGPLPLAENHRTNDREATASRILGPSWAHLPTLTIGLLGVQILWSVEMTYASPYLLSLGLTKSNMAIVFLAGPLSGFLMQPLIGVMADNSTSRWGRRRPYMLGGCVLCVTSILLLGFTREFAGIFTGRDNHANDMLTIWLAVLSIYLIDLSINAVQAVDRALLVDILPPTLQASGNAWAALMLGMGSVIGFFVGNLDLPSFLPFLGSSELQVLSVIVSVLILSGHLTTAVLVKESVLVQPLDHQRPSFPAEMRQIIVSIATLPRVIRHICMIQFFASLGWFPVLFYTTMYISDLYSRSAQASGTREEISAEGTRLGARALFFSAVLALATNLVLPLLTSTLSITPKPGFGNPVRFKLPLSTLWAGSHLLFGACMLGTFFVSSANAAVCLIAVTGIPWAVTQWAPFSLLAEAILTSSPAAVPKLEEEEDPLLRPPVHPAPGSTSSLNIPAEFDSPEEAEQLDRLDMRSPLLEKNGADKSLSARAGVILGIHNLFIVVPQFLVTILCAIVFAILDPSVNDTIDTSQDIGRRNSVVYVFRLGALWSLVAFLICRQLGRERGC